MRQFNSPINLRHMLLIVSAAMVLAMPLRALAQDAAPAETPVAEHTVEPVDQLNEAESPLPASGAIQILLSSTNGTLLAGAFAVNDAAGAYREVWVDAGSATIGEIAPGQASVTQLTGAPDYDFDPSAVHLINVPTGEIATVSIVNPFLDADGDGVGDSTDRCATGSDILDTDAVGTADACDSTPGGQPDPIVTPDSTEPTLTAAEDENAGSSSDQIQVDQEEAAPAEEATLSVEVDDTTIVVAEAPVSCTVAEDASPWISSDLDDYPPGALVTLTGGGWVPGQTVEIVVEDDGIADAEQGPWSHAATVAADAEGTFVYQFNLAPWFVADYSVVATGECSEARTAFTDSVSGGNCVQVTASDIVSSGQYVMFRCPSPLLLSPYIAVTSVTSGWQWAYQYGDANLTPPSYSSLSWSSTTGSTPSSGLVSQAYLFLSPTTAAPASTGSITVQARALLVLGYTSTLTAYRAISSTDFALSCAPASFSVQAASPQAVTCSLSAVNVASGAIIGVSIPASSAPTGWTITSPNPSTGTVSPGTPFAFSLSFTPSCTAATTAQSVSILSNLTFRTQSTAGPSTTIGVTRAVAETVSAAISSASLAWTRSYSFTAYPTNTGALTYSVQASGCAGWNITIVASPFVRSGGGSTIPASQLTLTSTTSPGASGISTPVTSGALNDSLKVMSASATNGVGTFSQTLNLNLAIPAGIPVGAYTSTVTVTAASGP